MLGIGLVSSVFAGTVGLSLSQSSTAYAGPCTDSNGNTPSIVGIPPWYDNLCDGKKIMSPKQFAGGSDKTGIGKFASIVAMNIVTILLYVVGYVSIGFIIWGGFKYMLSGDNSSGTGAAKTTILNAIIGLILSIMSIAIVKFIAGAIT